MHPVIEHFFADNGHGWRLSLRRTTHPHPTPSPGATPARPVLLLPGYGMNSFIFGFHPAGRSLEAHLAWRGLEVWSVDLRAQGRSVATSAASLRDPTAGFGLEALARDDVGAALAFVRAHTRTGSRLVDLIGCSLGAALMFGHAALGDPDGLGALVSLGGPLRWERIHPLVRLAFASPRLAGAIPFRGTQSLVRAALPLVTRAPGLFSVYVNHRVSDLSRVSEMAATVADPVPRINREIAEWFQRRDLHLGGVDLSAFARQMEHPLLCLVANGDGIVPPETARSPYALSGTADKALIEVGDRVHRFAHADLFIARDAHARVFDPIAAWLSGSRKLSPPRG